MKIEENSWLAILYFLFLGLSSLHGWNGVLTTLDFFSEKLPDYNIIFYFPIPVYVATNSFSLLIFLISKIINFNTRVIGSLLVIAAIFLILPLFIYYVPEGTAFWLCIFLIFMMASAGAILQCSAMAFTGIFPPLFIALYFTGTGISGLLSCFTRIICLSIWGYTEAGRSAGILMFFSFSALILFITILLHTLFIKSEFHRIHIERVRRRQGSMESVGLCQYEFATGTNLSEQTEIKTNVSVKLKDSLLIVNANKTSQTTKGDLLELYLIFKKIFPLPILMWLIYVQTFMMFPGLALKKNVSNLNRAWSLTLLVLTFNIFDTVGKFLSYFHQFYNLLSTSLLIFLRFFFFNFFILMDIYSHIPIICSDWFKFFNMALFSLLNGYATSCVMLLTPRRVKRHQRETAGFLMNFPLFFGILSGTVLALPLKDI